MPVCSIVKKRQSTVDGHTLGGTIMKTFILNTALSSLSSKVAGLALLLVINLIFVCGASAQTKIEDGNRCWTFGGAAIYDPQTNVYGGEASLNRHVLYGGRHNVDWLIVAGCVQDKVLEHRIHTMAGVKYNLNANPHHRVHVGIKALVGAQEQLTGAPAGAKLTGVENDASFSAWLANANWSGKLRFAAAAGVDLGIKFKAASRFELIASFEMQYRPSEGHLETINQEIDFSGSSYLEAMSPEELQEKFQAEAKNLSKKFSPRVSLGFRIRL